MLFTPIVATLWGALFAASFIGLISPLFLIAYFITAPILAILLVLAAVLAKRKNEQTLFLYNLILAIIFVGYTISSLIYYLYFLTAIMS